MYNKIYLKINVQDFYEKYKAKIKENLSKVQYHNHGVKTQIVSMQFWSKSQQEYLKEIDEPILKCIGKK